MTKTSVYYNDDYVASQHTFETTRKSARIAATLFDNPDIAIVDPADHTEATTAHIVETHSPYYLRALTTGTPRELAEAQGFGWDPNILTMATAHATGIVAAVDEVLTTDADVAGSLSSGLHHASYAEGAGFCTINGLAVAVREALKRGAERVLTLDFDAHAGGGTRSLTDPDTMVQVDVTVSPFDMWDAVAPDDYFDYTYREGYLESIKQALDHASGVQGIDLILYNAGMDPANSGVSISTLIQRERMVADWAKAHKAPLVYVLAGGYLSNNIDYETLIGLHRITTDTFVAS